MPSEGLARSGLQLAGLTSFAVARQYFEPLGNGADFFIEHGATGTDILIFALLFLLVPPALLLLVEWLVGLASEPARDAVHLVFVSGLVALIAWQAITEADPGARPLLAYLAALALGSAAGFVYARFELVRSWLTVLAVAPVLVLVLFLGPYPMRTLAFSGDGPEPQARASNGTPVVMIVLDELPTTSLMDARGRIDPVRYPGFAAFARDSTWYRNAASVADYTQLAVPAILTGKNPTAGVMQVASEHPDNLFTLLGGSYRLNVFEALTDLCRAPCERQLREPFGRRMRDLVSTTLDQVPALPPSLRRRVSDAISVEGPPEDARRSRPFPDESVRRFLATTQDVRFERFLDTLGDGRARTLDFMHLILPHRPWRYLPDGRRYYSPRSYRAGAFGRWPRDRRVVEIAWQRHLLQTALVDRMLARLVRRLKETGAYDRSLVVVVADHGSSFRSGEESRIVSRSNVAEIAPVPLLVKAPRQRRGRVDDSDVETTDVPPTIAKQLDIRLPWDADGVPADTRPRRRTLVVRRHVGGGRVTIGRRALERRRDERVRAKLAVFGPAGDPYRMGPRPDLAGRRIAAIHRRRVRAIVDAPGRYRSVDTRARSLPVDVTGEIRGNRPHRRPIAIAVNGVVAATAWSTPRGGAESFSALVRPSSLRAGRNRIQVFEVPAR